MQRRRTDQVNKKKCYQVLVDYVEPKACIFVVIVV